jgi:hypothetical protein
LIIDGNSSLQSISALSSLTNIAVALIIEYNTTLTSISGLNNLQSIGGYLYISENPGLIEISGFDKLTTINEEVDITDNSSLKLISGMNSLTAINGELYIGDNEELIDITGFTKLTSIGGGFTVILNASLKGLSSFESLTSIGGRLFIQNNTSLSSLNGLQNIDPSTIESTDGFKDLTIVNNSSLSECEIQSICDFLDLADKTNEIYGNKSGCKNESQIADACLAVSTFDDEWSNQSITVYPNPASDYFTIDFAGNNSEKAQIGIYDISSNLVRSLFKTGQETSLKFDISGINSGIYILNIRLGVDSIYKKLIVK